MRLASFKSNGQARFGAVIDGGVVDLTTADVPELRTALACWDAAEFRRRVERGLPVDTQAMEWLPPIVAPEKILCVGYNYRKHLLETGKELPSHPSIFVRFPDAQVGCDQPVIRPRHSTMFDYEGELAVVIGRGGRHVAAGDALAHVAGYACFAENSVRDYQRHTAQATAGKNFEHSGAFGPWLVTVDEIPDPAALTLVTRLNGQEMQRSGVDDLIFPIPELIAYISQFTRLATGDVIVTGTPEGIGSARKPPVWMRAGDVLEIEISGIGILRNTVQDEA